jgi:hypothetical protein
MVICSNVVNIRDTRFLTQAVHTANIRGPLLLFKDAKPLFPKTAAQSQRVYD